MCKKPNEYYINDYMAMVAASQAAMYYCQRGYLVTLTLSLPTHCFEINIHHKMKEKINNIKQLEPTWYEVKEISNILNNTEPFQVTTLYYISKDANDFIKNRLK